jgi:hypothetical protein
MSIKEFRMHTEYIVAALHQGVFQGIIIYFIPRESGS